MQPDQMNWLELLPGAVVAINAAPSKALNSSPFEISTPVPCKMGHVWWRFDLRAKFSYSSVRAPR